MMARVSDVVNVIAPVMLAIIIGVAFQCGYITYIKHPDEVSLTGSLQTLEQRLKTLESDIGDLGNGETQMSLKDLENRLDDVQKILEAVQHETREDINKLLDGGSNSDRTMYVTERDRTIFLMLGGLSLLQIGLVTSIYFLFRKLKKQSTEIKQNSDVTVEEKEGKQTSVENNNANGMSATNTSELKGT